MKSAMKARILDILLDRETELAREAVVDILCENEG